MYSLADLETVLEVARAGGVTAAARRLDLAPATVSHRVAKVEAALGATLFHRNSRTVHPSDDGRAFLERIEPLLRDLREAEAEAGGGRAALRGTLRLTMAPWILSRFVMPEIAALQAAHPALRIEVLAVDRYVGLVEEGQDCAIRVGALADSALIAQKLSDNDRILCAAPGFLARHGTPASAQDLQDARWVCLPWQTQVQVATGAGRRTLRIARDLTVSNSDTLTDAAVAGLGLALKSRLAVRRELAAGALVEVLPGCLDPAAAPIWFLCPPDARQGRKIAEARRLAQRAFAAAPGSGTRRAPPG